MSRRTLFLISALFLITFVLLMIALFQPQAPKITPKAIVKEPVAQTVLAFGTPLVMASPSIPTLYYSLPINISTGKNKVTAVQLELQYDPLVLNNVEVVPGTFFANSDVLLNQIDVKTGRISYAFSAGLTSEGVAGNGVVANLTFSAKTQTPVKTTIIFLPKTLVTAQGVNASVLKQTITAPFICGGDNSTPSAH